MHRQVNRIKPTKHMTHARTRQNLDAHEAEPPVRGDRLDARHGAAGLGALLLLVVGAGCVRRGGTMGCQPSIDRISRPLWSRLPW